MFARVTFPISSFQTFTYSVPVEFQKEISEGTCVHTTIGKRKLTGYVVAIEKSASFSGEVFTRDISSDVSCALNGLGGIDFSALSETFFRYVSNSVLILCAKRPLNKKRYI